VPFHNPFPGPPKGRDIQLLRQCAEDLFDIDSGVGRSKAVEELPLLHWRSRITLGEALHRGDLSMGDHISSPTITVVVAKLEVGEPLKGHRELTPKVRGVFTQSGTAEAGSAVCSQRSTSVEA
jgi:hypothetical protein